ncbi:hypothetical protein [Ruminococcus sp.]|uniref:hypothetical protein n=1 Tax=Ruminococcus sp. TaxID=41978 RepID=UPI0025EF1B6D|nr:hypothetical protein [Ruminococcus sp.]
MFGRKNKESDGFDYYYSSNNHREENTDYLKKVIQPYLETDEEILWIMCNGNVNAPNSLSIDIVKALKSAKHEIVNVVIIGALFAVFNNVIFVLIGLLTVSMACLLDKIFMFILLGLVVIILERSLKNDNNTCYVITDRRLGKYAYSQWIDVLLEDIKSTTVKISRGNKGSVMAKGTLLLFIIPDVEDPYRVQDILDMAIENNNAYQS